MNVPCSTIQDLDFFYYSRLTDPMPPSGSACENLHVFPILYTSRSCTYLNWNLNIICQLVCGKVVKLNWFLTSTIALKLVNAL